MKKKVFKWKATISDFVNQIIDINVRRHVFDEQRKIIVNNPALVESNIFIIYFFRNYAESQILAISRLVEDKQVQSLTALLSDILANYEEIIQSGELSKELIREIEGGTSDIFQRGYFTQQQNERIESFTWERINSDKFEILKRTAKIKTLRDKWVAHNDSRRKAMDVSYAEIAEVITFIENVTDEYFTLLTGGAMASYLPSGIESDAQIFNLAWHSESGS